MALADRTKGVSSSLCRYPHKSSWRLGLPRPKSWFSLLVSEPKVWVGATPSQRCGNRYTETGRPRCSVLCTLSLYKIGRNFKDFLSSHPRSCANSKEMAQKQFRIVRAALCLPRERGLVTDLLALITKSLSHDSSGST